MRWHANTIGVPIPAIEQLFLAFLEDQLGKRRWRGVAYALELIDENAKTAKASVPRIMLTFIKTQLFVHHHLEGVELIIKLMNETSQTAGVFMPDPSPYLLTFIEVQLRKSSLYAVENALRLMVISAEAAGISVPNASPYLLTFIKAQLHGNSFHDVENALTLMVTSAKAAGVSVPDATAHLLGYF